MPSIPDVEAKIVLRRKLHRPDDIISRSCIDYIQRHATKHAVGVNRWRQVTVREEVGNGTTKHTTLLLVRVYKSCKERDRVCEIIFRSRKRCTSIRIMYLLITGSTVR